MSARQLPAPAAPLALPVPAQGALCSGKRRDAAWARQRCVAEVRRLIQDGVTANTAFEDVALRFGVDPTVTDCLPQGCSGVSIERWYRKAEASGEAALADAYKGRIAQARDWALAAKRLFERPGACYASVARKLRRDGYPDASEVRVRRLLQKLPSNEAETSAKKLGASYRRANHSRHRIMDWSAVPVGGVYEGDGHCCKVYVEHPSGNGHFRPELTAWMDRHSRRIVGYWLSEAESAESAQYSLVVAIEAHKHVPAYLHVDPGSGFKNKQLLDQVTGFCPLLGIETIVALPGNAKGKGAIERWFKRLIKDFSVWWDTFMHDRTDDLLSRFETKLNRGELRLPTFVNFAESLARYIDSYNAEPLDVLGGKTPNQVWEEGFTDQREPALDLNQMLRRRETRAVRKGRVWIKKYPYGADCLAGFELRNCIVEIDDRDPSKVGIYTLEYRYVGEARLEPTTRALPEAFTDIKRRARLEDQIKRLERKAEMKRLQARQGVTLSAAEMLDVLDAGEIAISQKSEAEQVLAQGHSLAAPARTIAVARAAKPVSEAELQGVRNAIAAQSAPAEETPEQRFARWLPLQACADLDTATRAWRDTYGTSAECLGFLDVYESFGYVPGVTLPQTALTPPPALPVVPPSPAMRERDGGAAFGGDLPNEQSPAATGPCFSTEVPLEPQA